MVHKFYCSICILTLHQLTFMRPVIVQRPVNLPQQQFLPPNATYHPGYSSRAVVHQPQQVYAPTIPYHMQHITPSQPVYSHSMQTAPVQQYYHQYQPMYVQGPQLVHPMPPYYSDYMGGSYAPPTHRLQHTDSSQSIDYQGSSFLTETKVVQSSVFCVICGHNFKLSEKSEHLKKHMRKGDQSSPPLLQISTKTVNDSKVSNKKQYITKPLVQPEQHTIQYQPLVYELVQQVLYQDQAQVSMRDEAIGYQASFSLDPNISFDKGRNMYIPQKMQTEGSPFAWKGAPPSSNNQPNNGNTLNEPVPFVSNNPMQNSTNTYNSKMNQSRLSANQYAASLPLPSQQRSNLQANNLSVRQSQLKKP